MNIWFEDYLTLRNSIHDLTEYLIDPQLPADERMATEQLLNIRKNHLREFIILVSKYQGLENQILYKKYIETKSLSKIAKELRLSEGYIKKYHARMMEYFKLYPELNNQLMQFKMNFHIR